MIVDHKERFSPLGSCVPAGVKNEMRWYRGVRRPQKDAGVFIFRNSLSGIRNWLWVALLRITMRKLWALWELPGWT